MLSGLRFQIRITAIGVDHIAGDDGEEGHSSPYHNGGNGSNSHQEIVRPIAETEEIAPRSSLVTLFFLLFVSFLSHLAFYHFSI